MTKKCIICGNAAKFCVKDSSEYYCEECAEDNFSDLSLLQTVEKQAEALKKVIEEKLKEDDNSEEKEEGKEKEDSEDDDKDDEDEESSEEE